ncbi:2'-5' RNA ligase family protein [Mesorhizobium sp. B4-1-1]|uniref:2'-5' RNA ligase family protein n=1 Tax=Mesorhizobium sp. B4-1-1 TaxID=2589890 RepID=UPI001127C2F8|nr:2'-5' RNA ligase family protein [Mesorhizobium sp. B4-1-1]TPI21989.1 2'-5' RNA ligase family protein [Mesorhizobium sp. B4-1-1]
MSGEPRYGIDNKGQAFFSFGDSIPEQRWANGPHLFYGALVEKPTNDLLARKGEIYCREYRLLRAWLTPAEQMHITFIGLGDGKSEDAVDTACRIGGLMQAKPFDVCFDRLSAFGGGALVLRSSDHSPALQHFWRKLSAIVHDSPLQDFVTNRLEPHVTLLRDRGRVPGIQERLVEPVRWTVRSFALIHSHGGKYEFPGIWQLNCQDDAHAVM